MSSSDAAVAPGAASLPPVVINDEDLPFEEELLRNPHSLKAWQRYIEAKHQSKSSSGTRINMVYERALKELPGSYKLWYNYLKLRRTQVNDILILCGLLFLYFVSYLDRFICRTSSFQIRGRCVTDPVFEEVNNAFERALVFMHKMPRIWMDYCSFLVDQRKITRTRRVMDRALRALPITQHDRIWPLYIRYMTYSSNNHAFNPGGAKLRRNPPRNREIGYDQIGGQILGELRNREFAKSREGPYRGRKIRQLYFQFTLRFRRF